MGNKQLNYILVCTSNESKYLELNDIFKKKCKDKNITLCQVNVNIPEYQGKNIDNIIIDKMNWVNEYINSESFNYFYEKNNLCKDVILGFIVEDTSMGYDALNGLPGPYIKWFMQNISYKIFYEIGNSLNNRKATAICKICFKNLKKNDDKIIFTGKVNGLIVLPNGSNNFGWDPIFLPNGKSITFGQMSREEKNEISHRTQAALLFFDHINNLKN